MIDQDGDGKISESDLKVMLENLGAYLLGFADGRPNSHSCAA